MACVLVARVNEGGSQLRRVRCPRIMLPEGRRATLAHRREGLDQLHPLCARERLPLHRILVAFVDSSADTVEDANKEGFVCDGLGDFGRSGGELAVNGLRLFGIFHSILPCDRSPLLLRTHHLEKPIRTRTKIRPVSYE